jgi:Skp family chaperone for outer membrane proteins
MRAIFALIVIIVLAFIGYEYVYKGNPAPRSVDQAVQQARDAANEAADAARTAAQSARQQLGPAAQQAEQALQQGAEKLKQGAEELGQKAQQAASDAADKARQANQPQGPLVVDGIDLGTATREAVGRARAALATATDPTTADAQLTTLKGVNDKLQEIQGKLDALSAEGKRDLARQVAQDMPELRHLADRVKGIKGVGPDVGSTLDQILAKLDGWARAQA